MESSICIICTYSDFFWSVICTILVWKLCLFDYELWFWSVLILEAFSSWGIKKGQFQFFVPFLAVFFRSVNCTNLVCISSYFEHGQCFISGFLGFSFLVFSVFKNLKSNHLLFLTIFPDLGMLQFWSVNYICQVRKLYFKFGHVWNFGQYLYLSGFSKHWKYPTFSFC